MYASSILLARFKRLWPAALTVALLALLAGALLPETGRAQAPAETQEPFIGTWADTVEADGLEIRPVFHVRRGDERALTVTMDDPAVGVSDRPAQRVAVRGDSLILDWGFSRFEGALVATDLRITGTLAVGGRSFPLTMRPARESRPVRPTRPQRPEANPADVRSPDAIVSAAYDVISVADQENFDWDRFRSLFLPEARLISTGRSDDRGPWRDVMTVEQFVTRGKVQSQQRMEAGFVEREVHAETERFGDMAHVYSTYESVLTAKSSEPYQRGINSFQLWHDGDRWWIVSIFWHTEREDAPIPERYEK